MKKKLYLSAPLPFVGQKRMFAREFMKVLDQFPDDATFVDLFGGSVCSPTSPSGASPMPPWCTTISTTTAVGSKTYHVPTG